MDDLPLRNRNSAAHGIGDGEPEQDIERFVVARGCNVNEGGNHARQKGCTKRRGISITIALPIGGEAAKHFAAAASMEDKLTYMEPPDWPIPVRQLQGAAMLSLGRPVDAEKAFREDLKRFPNNGWSLSGLRESRLKQGRERDGEIGALQIQFQQAWRRADVKLNAGQILR